MATIGSLVFKIGTDTAELKTGVAEVNSKLDQLENGFTKSATKASFFGNMLADLAQKGARMAIDAIVDLTQRAEKVSAVSGSFSRLTQTVGETGQAFLNVSRTATKGLISDFDLMQAANKAILLGLPVTSQSFGQLAQTAVVLGRAMGQGPNKSLDDLIVALGRASPLILDNLGLTVKVGEANELYAAKLGKSSSQLTESEKKMAFYNAAIDLARQKVTELGGIQDRSTDIITKVKVAWDNLLNRMGEAAAKSPVLRDALASLSGVMDGWIAKVDGSARAMSSMDGAILGLLKGFNGLLSGLQYVQGGFNAFQTGIAAILAQAARSVEQHLTPMRFIFEQLAKIPGPMGDSFRLGFAAISAATKFAGDSALSYSQIQKEQEADFVRNAQAIENLQHKLGDLIGKLQHSKVVTEENAVAVRENAGATEAFGKSIADMGIKIRTGIPNIKEFSQKVDIKDVMERSVDGLQKMQAAAPPAFSAVSQAADAASRTVQNTTRSIEMMAATMSPWATSFTRGTLLTPGQGFTMSVPQRQTSTMPTWGNLPTGFQVSSTGTPYWYGHTGGGIDWTGVRRFHSGGLMQDEVPIVAQTGEGILSRRGMAALSALNNGGGAGMGGATVYVTVDAQGAFFDTPDSRERLGRMVSDAVIARMKAQGARI